MLSEWPIMRQIRRVLCFGLLLHFIFFGSAAARDYGVGAAATSLFSDNAFKVHSSKISERQDVFQLSGFAKSFSDAYSFDTNYVAAYNTFNEHSQPERTTLTGSGKLILGGGYDRLNALLSYDRRSLLNAPDAKNLLINTDEQAVLVFKPSARIRLTSVDLFSMFVEHASVDYKIDEKQNSTREGAGMVLQHSFSSINNIVIDASRSNVQFDAFKDYSYEYTLASLGYQAKSRHFQHRVSRGYNKTDSKITGEHSGAYYQGQFAYVSGNHQWYGNFNQGITDTSKGGIGSAGGIVSPATRESFLDSVSPDYGTTLGQGFDNIKQTTQQAGWNSFNLCNKCVMGLSYMRGDSDYLSLPVKIRQTAYQWNFSYTLSRLDQVSIKLQKQLLDYRLEVESRMQKGFAAEATYTKKFTSSISSSIRLKADVRDSQVSPFGYDEHQLSVTLNKIFY